MDKAKIKNNNCFTYPLAIDSLQMRDLYDSARWYIYTIYCDKIYKPKNDTSASYYFGELTLQYSNFVIKNDTIIIYYDFLDNNGQIILPSMMKTYQQLITGVGFNKVSRKKIFMESQGGFSVVTRGGEDNRYENSLQPKVEEYIKVNWNKLNDCFRILSEQKNIK